ncbi:hypothetical protein [Arthrobacter psychrolactophilus]
MDAVSGAEGQWIADALERYIGKKGYFGAVAGVIPDGFEAYARIFHRVDAYAEAPLRWAEIAAAKGTVIHPAVQFAIMAGVGDYEEVVLAGQRIGPPMKGELDSGQLATLAGILEAHTKTSDELFLAVWDGWGWLTGGSSVSYSFTLDGDQFVSNEALLEQAMKSAKEYEIRRENFSAAIVGEKLNVAHGLRQYFVFQGNLQDLAQPPWRDDYPGADSQTPNLAWPADRSWCMASEIDFDSTLVGGTAELIAAVVHSSGLEALEVTPSSDLSSEGDTINS